MQAGRRFDDVMRTDWVGGFPCRGPEAPQRALQAIFLQRGAVVKSSTILRSSAESPRTRQASQCPVEGSRKGLLVARTERGRAASDDAGDAGLLHEVPH